MSDENLRMRASIDDGFTGPLSKLRDALRLTNSSFRIFGASRDNVRGLNDDVNKLTNSLNSRLGLALKGVGIGGLSLGAGLGAAAIGLDRFARQTRSLSILGNQLNIPVQKLREFEALGKRFNMSSGDVQGGLKTFADNMFELQRNWGSAFSMLQGTDGAQFIIRDLQQALKRGGIAEAYEKLLEDLAKVQNLKVRRMISQLLTGSDQAAIIATESTRRVREEWAKGLAKFGPETERAAESFVNNMNDITQSLDRLKVEGLAPVLPEVNRFLDLLGTKGSAGDSFVTREAKSLAQALHDINTYVELMNKGDWSGIINRLFIAPGRSAKLTEKRADLKSLDDALRDIESGRTPGSPTQTAEIRQRRDELVREIEKLRKALEEANQNGGLVQQQSFLGGGGGMPRIMNASLGGLGGGAGTGLGGVGGMRSSSGNAAVAPGRGAYGNTGKGRRDVARAAADEMRAAGLSEKAIAGVMANVKDESNFNPNLRHFDQPKYRGTEAENAHGLYQMGGLEWNRYAGWLSKHYPQGDWRDPRLQTRFLMENLKANYPSLWRKMQGASSEEAAQLFVQQYLKPRRDFMIGRMNKYGRGVPGVENYTGREDSREIPLPRAAPPEIRGNARLDINLNGLPPGATVRTSFDGMFRELNVSRQRQMGWGENL